MISKETNFEGTLVIALLHVW